MNYGRWCRATQLQNAMGVWNSQSFGGQVHSCTFGSFQQRIGRESVSGQWKESFRFAICHLWIFPSKQSWNCRKYSDWPFWNPSPHFKYLLPSSILLYLICLIHVSFGATRWSGEVGCCWTAPSQWWTAFSRDCCFQRSNAQWISPRLASPWSTTWWDCCPLVWPFTLKDHAR